MKKSSFRPSPLSVAACLAAVGLLIPIHARAHAFIDHAEPAVGGTVPQGPAEVAVTFTEPVELKFSRVKVFDTTGNEVDRKDLHLDPKNPRRLVVSLPSNLNTGQYKVNWHVVSKDTHTTGGEYRFTVGS